MTMSNYLCHIVGEQPERVARMHASTVKRTKAFAIAIHIPVMLWAVTGYVIASKIFELEPWSAAAIAVFCSGLIYMVERVVLATPKVWYVNVSRVIIGLVISVLGASTVDLVIFDREVTQQLREAGEAQIRADHEKALDQQKLVVTQKKADWMKAQDAANCEANGTCGSMVRSVGPVYKELARQAETMKSQYMEAQVQLSEMNTLKSQAIGKWREVGDVGKQTGLLTRIEALHQYTSNNTAAFVAWVLFFVLVLFFELMVVLSKLVFGETVDDELDQIREQISQQKARAYMEAVTSPVANARQLLESAYS
jgi:hypothetical protein